MNAQIKADNDSFTKDIDDATGLYCKILSAMILRLFKRLSDAQNEELRSSKTNVHIHLLKTSSGKKVLPIRENVFQGSQTFHTAATLISSQTPSTPYLIKNM